jgi:hypothetical protein
MERFKLWPCAKAEVEKWIRGQARCMKAKVVEKEQQEAHGREAGE